MTLAGASHYAAGDFDGDGLADLCRVDDTGVEVLLNDGGQGFRQVAAEAGGFDLCLFADYDHDNDYDLLRAGARQAAAEERRRGFAGRRQRRFPLR